MVDEIHVFIVPIVLISGIDLFEALPKETKLNLIDIKSYSNGVVELKYKVE